MATESPLSASVRELKGVGPKLAQVLAKKGISRLEDALYYLPRAYEDRRHITSVSHLEPGKPATVFGKIVSSRMIGHGRHNRFEATISDKHGRLRLVWFHAYPSLAAEFEKETWFLVYGTVEFFAGQPQIVHPEYEKVAMGGENRPPASLHFGRVVPVYSETEGLNQKLLRRVTAESLKRCLDSLDDPLPETLRTRLTLPSLRESFVSLHYPSVPPEEGKLSAAERRVAFEEFFVLQLGLQLKKRKLRRAEAHRLADPRNLLPQFIKRLPYRLTEDQQVAIGVIQHDLAGAAPMARLLQGDVGAGKTVVALAAAAIAAGSEAQAAILAPTEILAQQHYKLALKLFEGVADVQLVVSANSSKRETREAVESGRAKIIVGTHALFQSAIKFHRLAVVVVDEQHRFGVEQRTEMLRKGDGKAPHLLMMTATPIPRTLALTLYGDLDLSILREKPAGRRPVTTHIIQDRERPKLYNKIRETIERGEQVYLIYPLIEASEKLDLKSATEMYLRLAKEVFPQFRIALLHGRLKPEEKDQIITDFKGGHYSLLVSTTVIEVGIDVANATLMVIEHPERLGLSQLHQLRGRVGRGSKSSECMLVADGELGKRLEVMERTEDGFVIAEEDLKIRGPGEFLGIRQSGLPGFRVGHIVRDAELLIEAKEEAEKLLNADPELKLPENDKIKATVESRWGEKIERLMGG